MDSFLQTQSSGIAMLSTVVVLVLALSSALAQPGPHVRPLTLEGCGQHRGCIVYPPGCHLGHERPQDPSPECDFIYAQEIERGNQDNIRIQMLARGVAGWIAVGFNTIPHMVRWFWCHKPAQIHDHVNCNQQPKRVSNHMHHCMRLLFFCCLLSGIQQFIVYKCLTDSEAFKLRQKGSASWSQGKVVTNFLHAQASRYIKRHA